MSQSSFRDNPAKKMVRENWNTPFLKYLHEKYAIKYRYMGFPGTDLTDIKLWKEMIEWVVAFELPAPGRNKRIWIDKLRTNLLKLGVPGIVHYGSLEQVVVLREDLDGIPYEQDTVITLYNLDFCDEICSKVATPDAGKELLRFEALRQILQDQKKCYVTKGGPTYFIILLTVRNQIDGSKIRELLKQNLFHETDQYCSACSSIDPIPKEGFLLGSHTWAIKAFIYNCLKSYFGGPHVSALFFPFVRYMGTPKKLRTQNLDSPMLHWMMLCKFEARTNASPVFTPEHFLNKVATVLADITGFTLQPEPGEANDPDQPISAIEWFKKVENGFFNGNLR